MLYALALPVGSMITYLTLAGLGVLAVVAAVLSAFYFARARVYERIESTLPAASGEASEMRALGERIEALVGQQQLQGETQRQMLAQKIDAVGQRFDEQRLAVDGIRNEMRHEARRRDAEMDEIRHQIAAIQHAAPALADPSAGSGQAAPPLALDEPAPPPAPDVPSEAPIDHAPAWPPQDSALVSLDAPSGDTAPGETIEFESFTVETVPFEMDPFETAPVEAADSLPLASQETPSPHPDALPADPSPDTGWADTTEDAFTWAAVAHPADLTELEAVEPEAVEPEAVEPAAFEPAAPAPEAMPETAPVPDGFAFETFTDPFAEPSTSAPEVAPAPVSPFDPWSVVTPDEASRPTPAPVPQTPLAPAPTPPAHTEVAPGSTAWVSRSDRPEPSGDSAPAQAPPAVATPAAAAPDAFDPFAEPAPAAAAKPFVVPDGAEDLTVVSSIDVSVQHALYLAGITKLDEIARWGRGDARRISAQVGVSEETIMNQWIFEAQAALFDQFARQTG